MTTKNQVAQDLQRLLAHTYLVYLKTQNFHWNVTGKLFFMLHAAFEEQYEQLAEATDVLAERLRALKFQAPGTFEQFQQLSSIKSETTIPPAHVMIQVLLEDHDFIIGELGTMIKTAEREGDDASMDLMIERMAEHQKIAWMLRSSTEAE